MQDFAIFNIQTLGDKTYISILCLSSLYVCIKKAQAFSFWLTNQSNNHIILNTSTNEGEINLIQFTTLISLVNH